MNRLVALGCLLPSLAAAQPSTDIYLFDLKVNGSTVTLTRPRNVTPHAGYDNQPFFHPGRPLLFYSSAGADGRTDLKSYNYRTGETRQLTATPEREYSPTLTEDEQFLSCIIQRDTGQQDLGKYPLAGGPATLLIDNLKVGYHAWIDRSRLLVYVLAAPANELHDHDLATGRDTVIARNIGRSLKRIPHQAAISFLQQTPAGTWLIQRFDTRTRAITTLGPALERSEDVAWTQNGLMLMSNGAGIFCCRPGQSWQPVAMPGPAPALRQASRLAVNPADNTLAVVMAE